MTLLKLPDNFIQSLLKIKGFDEKAFQEVHQSNNQVTSIRYNAKKVSTIPQKQDDIEFQNISWCNNAFYLSKRPSFTLDPCFHAGVYYVQEASSMFLQYVLKETIDLNRSLKVLDLCAAPGGKSTLIQSVISKTSVLISNEIIKSRANILTENITKWGAENVIVTNNNSKDFKRLENYFDAIIVDAPCSGSGLFRKDNWAIEEWSENNVMLCNKRQQNILTDIISSLKENGVLIYSTCSYSIEENETIADWLITTHNLSSIKINVPNEWNIVSTLSPIHQAQGFRFYPNKLKGEGFYIAAFVKPQHKIQIKPIKTKDKQQKPTDKQNTILNYFIKHPNDFYFIKQMETFIAMPVFMQHELAIIQAALYIKKAGVKMGEIIKDELIPNHELALSTIKSDTIYTIAVDLKTALQYLRKQEIEINKTKIGWALLTFNNLAIGWVKILPNRVNNYYPKEWRIVNK